MAKKKRKTTNNHKHMRSVWIHDKLMDAVAAKARVSSRTTRGQVEFMLACYLDTAVEPTEQAEALLASIYYRGEEVAVADGTEAQSV